MFRGEDIRELCRVPRFLAMQMKKLRSQGLYGYLTSSASFRKDSGEC